MDRTDYKAGQVCDIFGIPNDKTWGYHNDKNGDTITLSDPPTQTTSHNFHGIHTKSKFILNYDNGYSWIPPEWVKPTSSSSEPPKAVCTCDVWLTGCVCGVFENEERLRRSGEEG